MAASLEVLEERIGSLMSENSDVKRLISEQERRHSAEVKALEERHAAELKAMDDRWTRQLDEFKKIVGENVADFKNTLRNYGKIGVGLLTSALVATLVIIVQGLGK